MTLRESATYYVRTLYSAPNAWGQNVTPCGLRSDVFYRKMVEKFGEESWNKILNEVMK